MRENDHRRMLGKRLQEEMTRKGLAVSRIADTAGVEESVVSEYLGGERSIRFSELTPICNAMEADPMRMLSPSYSQPRLSYRNSSAVARSAAAAVENAFLLIREWLSVPLRPRCQTPHLEDSAFSILIAETRASVEELRAKYQTVEALYEAHRLPVLGLAAGPKAFDAFLLHCGKHFLVCVNTHKPNARIEFSLLHEFAHFAFDVGHDIPLDENIILASDLYGYEVPRHARREYVANKFAQLWLVPFENAQQFARDWKRGGDYVRDNRVSPDVVANAIRDAIMVTGRRNVTLADIREGVCPANEDWEGRKEVREWIMHQTQRLTESIEKPLDDEFGEERRRQVKRAMGMENG